MAKKGGKMKKYNSLIIIVLLCLSFLGCSNDTTDTAVSSDGVEISYHKQGKGNPTLVFVHGWTNDKTIWDDQVSHFSEKYKVVTLDIAGHGVSGDNRENWSMSAFGDDVAAVVNKLKLKEVVLVGFSLGGPIIVETANKIPEIVKGLIFVDTMQDPDLQYTPEMVDGIKGFMMNAITNPSKDGLKGVFFKRNIDESFNKVLSMLEGPSRIGWEEAISERFRWQNENFIQAIKAIKAPIVAINSNNQSTNVEAFKKYVPSFKAIIMEDVGHVVFWDSPEEFNNHVEESIQEML
jgi:pimeloyl-ACP methyl ester carboxylesterase